MRMKRVKCEYGKPAFSAAATAQRPPTTGQLFCGLACAVVGRACAFLTELGTEKHSKGNIRMTASAAQHMHGRLAGRTDVVLASLWLW